MHDLKIAIFEKESNVCMGAIAYRLENGYGIGSVCKTKGGGYVRQL